MRAVWLLATNLVREQRIIVWLALGWMLGFAAIFSFAQRPGEGLQDIETLYRQELAYGIILAVFNGASLVFNERKSRRILAVLSKGVSRAQYLAAVLLSSALVTGLYYVAVAVSNVWLAHRFGSDQAVWSSVIAACIAAQLAAAIAMVFGTVMHPMFAAVGASVIIAIPAAIDPVVQLRTFVAMPVSLVIRELFKVTYASGWQAGWSFTAVAAIETAIAFAIAAFLFRHKDVTVPVD